MTATEIARALAEGLRPDVLAALRGHLVERTAVDALAIDRELQEALARIATVEGERDAAKALADDRQFLLDRFIAGCKAAGVMGGDDPAEMVERAVSAHKRAHTATMNVANELKAERDEARADAAREKARADGWERAHQADIANLAAAAGAAEGQLLADRIREIAKRADEAEAKVRAIRYELAALIAKPCEDSSPSAWPETLNPADRECLSKAFAQTAALDGAEGGDASQ